MSKVYGSLMKKRKNILITGVTSGIGWAMAIKFAQEGYDIIGQYHTNKTKGESLKKELIRLGSDVILIKADLSSDEGLQQLLASIKDLKIYGLINNAGSYIEEKHYTKLTPSFLKEVFMLNTFTPMILSSNVMEGMKNQKEGHIVNISSIAAKYGSSVNTMPYASSKLALEGMTKTLAREGAECNVMVNTVRPGIIETDFHKKFPKDLKKRAEMVPVKRVGKPHEVAELVFFIMHSSSFLTNEIMTVAGGE